MTDSEFTALARRYMDMIFRIAFGMTKSRADADDVTQNVLLALYRSGREFDSEQHLKNWLARCAVNECRKIFRSPFHKAEDFDSYSETLIFEEERYSELYAAIMALERKYRTVVVLHYCEGYSIAEIADILKIPPGTVGTRLSRAREKLRSCLSEADKNE